MFNFQRAILASFLTLLVLNPVLAADGDDLSNQELLRLLKLRLGTEDIAPARETRAEGVYQTRFGNKFAYLIDGGRYVFIGDMVDLESSENLTELSRRDFIVEQLASFSEDQMIIFPAEKKELAVLNVFTDTSCGYCQKLHEEVGYLQAAGISVHYLPYPRGGSRGPGYSDLRKVWCAEDQLEAMSIAKRASSGKLSKDSSCVMASAVDQGYELGNRIGVAGTPALYDSKGGMFNGYVPYKQLIPQLLSR